MLYALRDVLKFHDDEALNDDVKTFTYNKGKYRSANDHLKVWPTNAGRDVIKILGSSEGLIDICNRFPVKDAEKNKVERPPMVQAYLFFYAVLSCLIRGKRFDDPMSPGEYGDEHTVARAVIRSIEKDNAIKIPFADEAANLAPAELLRDALQNCFQIMRLQLDAEDDPQIIFETLTRLPPFLKFLEYMRDLQVIALAKPDIVIKQQVQPGILETALPLFYLPELRPFGSAFLIGLLIEAAPIILVKCIDIFAIP